MTYTVCEDRPWAQRWDVEIRTFRTRQEAENFIRRRYTSAERNGESDTCKPILRSDESGEYVG